jgi:3-methyl-2-oxobutanoate hydroxymethyltransferase
MSTRIDIVRLREMKRTGEKIVSLTAYDASFARLLAECGVEIVLVGDSLGTVLHGARNTLGVTLDDVVYHTRITSRAAGGALVLADMPFMSYATPEQAFASAARLVGEAGAHMVKLEGGAWLCTTVERLAERGIPVCGHLGLTPQWVRKFGGHRVQGREPEAADRIVEDAKALEAAGAELLVLECVPASLGERVSRAVSMPVIGIGAGPGCDGQVLVLYDMIGVSERPTKMAKDFLEGTGDIRAAVRAYVAAVKDGSFPGPEHGFE